MNLIIFLLLLVSCKANFYTHPSCSKIILENEFRVYVCKDVDWWSHEEEHVAFHNKKYVINPFSPNRIWLNASNVPMGMSNKKSFVLLVDEGENIQNISDISMLMTRFLNGETFKTDIYQDTDKLVKDYDDEIRYNSIEETYREMVYYIFDYLLEHVYDHKDVKTIIKDYYEDENTVGTWGFADLHQLDTHEENTPFANLKFICTYSNGTKEHMIVDGFEDKSNEKAPDNVKCNFNIHDMLGNYNYAENQDEASMHEFIKRYGSD